MTSSTALVRCGVAARYFQDSESAPRDAHECAVVADYPHFPDTGTSADVDGGRCSVDPARGRRADVIGINFLPHNVKPCTVDGQKSCPGCQRLGKGHRPAAVKDAGRLDRAVIDRPFCRAGRCR